MHRTFTDKKIIVITLNCRSRCRLYTLKNYTYRIYHTQQFEKKMFFVKILKLSAYKH